MRIAAIRVRSGVRMSKSVADTLKMLKLYKTNTCVILKEDRNILGMLEKVKDYITWGQVTEQTIFNLLQKRGKLVGNKPLTENYVKEKLKIDLTTFSKDFFESKRELKDIPGIKPFFRLN